MMRLGALLGPIVDAAQPHALAEQARRYAGEGFASLWSAQAIGRGFMMSDPFVTLSVAASVTDGVEIGTAVLQVPLYQPFDLAHRIFSLRQLCGDRLLLGVGAGSTEKDFVTLGRDYKQRFATFGASMQTLRKVLNEGGADGFELSPWPVVRGVPPLLLGSWGRGVVRAAQQYDGWIASAMHRTPEQVCEALLRYRATRADRSGAGAGAGTGAVARTDRAIVSTIQVTGATDLGKLRDTLLQFSSAGFDDAVVMILPGGPAAAVVRALLNA